MATQADNSAADKSSLRKLALPAAVAAVGAGIGYLTTKKPSTKRLRGLLSRVPGGADDLIDDLKDRVQSVGGESTPQPAQISQRRLDELEARRRERKKRRNQRQRRAKT
jgi:hypothetical protein